MRGRCSQHETQWAGRAGLWWLKLMLESRSPPHPPSPSQAEETALPPAAVVPVSEAGGAAEGHPDAV